MNQFCMNTCSILTCYSIYMAVLKNLAMVADLVCSPILHLETKVKCHENNDVLLDGRGLTFHKPSLILV